MFVPRVELDLDVLEATAPARADRRRRQPRRAFQSEHRERHAERLLEPEHRVVAEIDARPASQQPRIAHDAPDGAERLVHTALQYERRPSEHRHDCPTSLIGQPADRRPVPAAGGRQTRWRARQAAGQRFPARRTAARRSTERRRVRRLAARVTTTSYAIGYYTAADLPFYGNAAPYWTVCDRYFSAIMAETYPNRFYLHAGADRSPPQRRGPTIATLPTIWDRLAAAGLDRPLLLLRRAVHRALGRRSTCRSSRTVRRVLRRRRGRDASRRSRFVDPRFLDEELGHRPATTTRTPTSASARPSSPRSTSAVTTSPAWERTVFVITYDEWGGFFDHVAAARRAATRTRARAAARLPRPVHRDLAARAPRTTSRTASTTTRRSSR